jgi:aspartate-semialdehyde dehydrogenase
MVVALKPLHDLARIRRVVVATYQASSGKGATGLQDLDAQLQAIGRGQPVPPPKAHAAQLAGNVITHDWKLGADGYTEEEWKMIKETRKIMGDDSILVSPTTVRVPVRIGHSEAINLELERPISPEQAPRGTASGTRHRVARRLGPLGRCHNLCWQPAAMRCLLAAFVATPVSPKDAV